MNKIKIFIKILHDIACLSKTGVTFIAIDNNDHPLVTTVFDNWISVRYFIKGESLYNRTEIEEMDNYNTWKISDTELEAMFSKEKAHQQAISACNSAIQQWQDNISFVKLMLHEIEEMYEKENIITFPN